jgi:RNA polymerase subunit RPABC4/transcription elongation factor Spt4
MVANDRARIASDRIQNLVYYSSTHGDWCQSRNWDDIFHNPPKKGKPGIAPVKDCPECNRICAASTRICPECGHLFPPPKEKVETELAEFILVTKDMDVLKIIEDNKHRKEYYSFFQIAQTLAAEAKYSTKEMTEEKFNFILQLYYEKAKVWCANSPSEKRRTFNQWHKDLAKKTLIEQLQKHYRKWEPLNQQ